MARATSIYFLLIGAVLTSCTAHKPPPKPTATAPTQISLTMHAPGSADPHDPMPELHVLIHLDIYQFEVPLGAISTDEAFWKRVDELSVAGGPATSELLFKNGLRCGIAAKSDWAYFRDLLDQQPNRTRKTMVTKSRVDALMLDLDKPTDSEDLFYFDSNNHLQGRSYESCTNSVSLSFQPAPRDPGSIRMAWCPVVTTHRRKLQFTALNQEYESPFEEISRLYDVSLKIDVPENNFLIVAPSADARRATSLGGQFLVNKDKAERLEQVLVIVPTFLRMDGKPFTLTEDLQRH